MTQLFILWPRKQLQHTAVLLPRLAHGLLNKWCVLENKEEISVWKRFFFQDHFLKIKAKWHIFRHMKIKKQREKNMCHNEKRNQYSQKSIPKSCNSKKSYVEPACSVFCYSRRKKDKRVSLCMRGHLTSNMTNIWSHSTFIFIVFYFAHGCNQMVNRRTWRGGFFWHFRKGMVVGWLGPWW